MDDALVQIDPEAQGKIIALLKGPLAHVGLLGIGNGAASETATLYQPQRDDHLGARYRRRCRPQATPLPSTREAQPA